MYVRVPLGDVRELTALQGAVYTVPSDDLQIYDTDRQTEADCQSWKKKKVEER